LVDEEGVEGACEVECHLEEMHDQQLYDIYDVMV